VQQYFIAFRNSPVFYKSKFSPKEFESKLVTTGGMKAKKNLHKELV
jgi:hypothetical protein